jgi:hypothetical protein
MFNKTLSFFYPEKDISISLIQDINKIYGESQQRVHLFSPDLTWHTSFINVQRKNFAAIDQIDLNCPFQLSIYENTIRYWIAGFYKVSPQKEETLAQYSQRAMKESKMYQDVLNQFHEDMIASEALEKVKTLIRNDKGKKSVDMAKQLEEIHKKCEQGQNSKNPMQFLKVINQIVTGWKKTDSPDHEIINLAK